VSEVVATFALFRLRRIAAVDAWLGTIGFLSVPLIDVVLFAWRRGCPISVRRF
jgi:hypothetical protein